MSFGQVAGYFLDTCILLPQNLDARLKTCHDFLKENLETCYISSSVRKEGLNLIQNSHDVILNHFQLNLKSFINEKKIKEITRQDGRIFAEYFSQQKASFRPIKTTSIPYEILEAIESYVASQIHSIERGQKLPADFFLATMATNLAMIKNDLGKPFRSIKCEEIAPSDKMCSAVTLGAIMEDSDDLIHLASALEYQFKKNKWVIFVTLDGKHILAKTKVLKEIFLHCSKPDWALDFFRDLTRYKSPKEYLSELPKVTLKQKRLIEAI